MAGLWHGYKADKTRTEQKSTSATAEFLEDARQDEKKAAAIATAEAAASATAAADAATLAAAEALAGAGEAAVRPTALPTTTTGTKPSSSTPVVQPEKAAITNGGIVDTTGGTVQGMNLTTTWFRSV